MEKACQPIHILGLGNVGRFLAHSLKLSKHSPPIHLLFHRDSLREEWEAAQRQIEFVPGNIEKARSKRLTWRAADIGQMTKQMKLFTSQGAAKSGQTWVTSNYTVEPVSGARSGDSLIQNLVVATKCCQTLKALSAVVHRLDSNTTILFTQNGMGVLQQVNTLLFPDESVRPKYLVAINYHGLFSAQRPFTSVLAAPGRISLCEVTQPSSATSSMIEAVLRAPFLNATYHEPKELQMLQYEKLAINALINPLTAVFRSLNGGIFGNYRSRVPLVKLMERMAAEVSAVLLSLDGEEKVKDRDRFSAMNLERLAIVTAELTKDNMSSMLQDVLNGKQTEIDYINGWIVQEGERRGIDVSCNKQLVELVKGEMTLDTDDVKKYFPGTVSQDDIVLGIYRAEKQKRRDDQRKTQMRRP